jgi:hypothetical protein
MMYQPAAPMVMMQVPPGAAPMMMMQAPPAVTVQVEGTHPL